MQKITPCLWFQDRCEEAVKLYTSLFEGSAIQRLKRYPEGMEQEFMRQMEGKVLTAIFELAGQRFFALDGGAHFKQTPAISLFVSSDTAEETQRLWDALSAGGQVLMPLQGYPWSAKYGWCTDQFGISWQLFTGSRRQRTTHKLMFTGEHFGQAEEAMRFWAAVLPDSQVEEPHRYPEGDPQAGKLSHGEFSLSGYQFMVMDSAGPHEFGISGATSFMVGCADQAELDRYWEALASGGGQHLPCGWLKDRFGVHWQINPEHMGQLVDGPDEAGARRAFEAMMTMGKLDIAALEAAYEGR